MVFFFHAEDGIRDRSVTGVQTCAFRSDYQLVTNLQPLLNREKAFFYLLKPMFFALKKMMFLLVKPMLLPSKSYALGWQNLYFGIFKPIF